MTQQPMTLLPAASDRLMEEAGVYSLLAEFFLHNPDKALTDALKALDPAGFSEVSDLAGTVERLLAYLRLSDADADGQLLDLKRDWTKLFRGVSPSYGPTAPYGLLFLKGNVTEMMADLAALYLDGGYDGYQQLHDRLDYIGVGFKYLHCVCLQMAHAVETRDAAEFGRLQLCRRFFLEHYFLPWVPEFCERARHYVKTPFYEAVLDMAVASLDAYAEKDLKREAELLSAEESRRRAEAEEQASKTAQQAL